MADITLIFEDGTVENIYLPFEEITEGNLVDMALDYSSQSEETLANYQVADNA